MIFSSGYRYMFSKKHLKVKTSWIPGILQNWHVPNSTMRSPGNKVPLRSVPRCGICNFSSTDFLGKEIWSNDFGCQGVPKNSPNLICSHNWFWGGLIMFRYRNYMFNCFFYRNISETMPKQATSVGPSLRKTSACSKEAFLPPAT